jgi:hypothetical protein
LLHIGLNELPERVDDQTVKDFRAATRRVTGRWFPLRQDVKTHALDFSVNSQGGHVMFDKRRGLGNIGMSLLICGACACGQSQQANKGIDLESQQGFDGVTSTHFDLLSSGCALVAPTTTALGTATFTVNDNETLYLFERIADGQVVANTNIGTTTTECAFPTTYRINISSVAGTTHKVFLDFYYGAFGVATAAYSAPKAPATTTTTGPNIILTLTGTSNTLQVRGTSHPDIVTFGTLTATTYGSFAFGSLVTTKGVSTETAPKARTYPDLSATGLTNIMVSTGPGDDVITAQGGTPIGGSTKAPGILDGAIAMDVYGGDGNDIMTSGGAGTAVNNLFGGCGNDVFLQQAALAHDVITATNVACYNALGVQYYDTGDTADYSVRTNPLTITLGDDAIAIPPKGQITAVKFASLADNDSFTVSDGTTTTVFEYEASASPLAHVDATGSIKVLAPGSMHDGDGFVLNDGVNAAVTFEYNVIGGAYTPVHGATAIIDISAATTAIDVADLTYAVIVVSGPVGIAATDPSSLTDTIILTNASAHPGSVLNQAITQYGSDLTIVGMSGGAGPTAGRTGISVVGLTDATSVAVATAAAITTAYPTTLTATNTDGIVNITLAAATKPAGAAITWTSGQFAVTDFTTGSAAPGANDGETSENDSLDINVNNVVGGTGADYIDASLATGVSHILYGMSGADTLIGSDLADTLYGGWGNDVLKGGAGQDILVGGDGNDTLQGGAGSDVIKGDDVNCPVATVIASGSSYATYCTKSTATASTTAGVNTLDYSDRTKSVTANLAALSTVTAGTDGLPICGGATVGVTSECDLVTKVQNLRGGAGDDFLYGDANANVIWGGAGDDTIIGLLASAGAGSSDAFYGEMGDDTINNANNTSTAGSVMSGGTGVNTITGGAGNNSIDNSQGAAGGIIDCGSGDAEVLLKSGKELSILHCQIQVH